MPSCNFWTIVLGPKDPDIKPVVLMTYVHGPAKKRMLDYWRERYPGQIIRAIPQVHGSAILHSGKGAKCTAS